MSWQCHEIYNWILWWAVVELFCPTSIPLENALFFILFNRGRISWARSLWTWGETAPLKRFNFVRAAKSFSVAFSDTTFGSSTIEATGGFGGSISTFPNLLFVSLADSFGRLATRSNVNSSSFLFARKFTFEILIGRICPVLGRWVPTQQFTFLKNLNILDQITSL